MTREHREPGDGNEDAGHQRAEDPRRKRFGVLRQAHVQGVLHRTNRHSLETAHALIAPDSPGFVYVDPGGTRFGAQCTVDTR